jgi:hypothetical protein
MEIQALKLLVPEDVVNRLIAEHTPKDVPLQDLAVQLSPDGVHVQGKYPTMFMKVAFETVWAVTVMSGQLEVRLADVKVSGFPATMLRGLIFKMMKESTDREPGLSVEGETLRVDIEQFLAAKGLPLRVNLTNVRCGPGSMVIEAGTLA